VGDHARERACARVGKMTLESGRDVIETYKTAIRKVQEPLVASREGPATRDVLKVLRKTFGKIRPAAFRVAWKETPRR
jgi:hypothetical protein